MQQRVTSTDNPASLLKTIQHWAPQLVLSIIINLALLKLFLFLIATSEPVATEKSRLHVRLVQNTPQEKILPPKPPEPPKKLVKPKPKPKPKVVKPQPEKPKPVVKPPQPKQIVQAKKPPPEPEQQEEPPEVQVTPLTEDSKQETETIAQNQQEQVATNQPVPSQAPIVSKIVPLFRLTRMPKVMDYNAEILKRFYPEDERDFGKEATVEAMILVDEKGKIVEIEIIKSAGARFDAAAKKALLSNALVIEPGYIGDKPVASRVPIPITFNLTD